MAKEIIIKIENSLVLEKRAINVYHYFTRSVHLISHDSSTTIPLMSVLEDDYLHISIVSGPGPMRNKCIVNLPALIDFEFSPGGDIAVRHSDNRTIVEIPPGPTWQLKITWSPASRVRQTSDLIIIGDD